MAVWSFDRMAPALNAVGMAAAKDRPIDLGLLAKDLDESREGIEMLLEHLDHWGLVMLAPADEPELPPLLTRAGSQFLAMKGNVRDEVLSFLPGIIDDLHARDALISGGTVLVDEFRYQVVKGSTVDHAASLVPGAFEGAVDDEIAINLFAAAVALMARLSCGKPAGCLAEEIMAVALLENATIWLEMKADRGELEAEAVETAQGELRGIFELFEDDDVLNLFEMEEPADAALAGHSWINQQMAVVDQRLEAWFRPFGGVIGTGYLDEREKGEESGR
jgi:hypothetical protein